jgi:hypothetical protein
MGTTLLIGPPSRLTFYVVDGIGTSEADINGVRLNGEHYGVAGSLWVAEWLLSKIVASRPAVRHPMIGIGMNCL